MTDKKTKFINVRMTPTLVKEIKEVTKKIKNQYSFELSRSKTIDLLIEKGIESFNKSNK